MGEIVVRPISLQPERYTDRQQALDRMADLMAQALHDPLWGQRDDSTVRRPPSKPLYPV
jgi:hypothetical protein